MDFFGVGAGFRMSQAWMDVVVETWLDVVVAGEQIDDGWNRVFQRDIFGGNSLAWKRKKSLLWGVAESQMGGEEVLGSLREYSFRLGMGDSLARQELWRNSQGWGCFGADFGRYFGGGGEVRLRREFGIETRGDRFSEGIFF